MRFRWRRAWVTGLILWGSLSAVVQGQPNNRSLANQVASDVDPVVKVWDAATGREKLTIKGRPEVIWSVAFSPDGAVLATAGSQDDTIQFWNAASGRETLALKGHRGDVKGVAFSPDGKRLASAGNDGTVKIWETTHGQMIHSLKGHSGQVWSVAFSPDGARLASASWDRTIRLWDAALGQEVRTLNGHTDEVKSVSFSPDGTRLASASWDRTVKLWDATTGRELRSLAGHAAEVTSAVFGQDGNWLASSSWDKTVKLWDLSTGQELRTLSGHTDSVTSLAFSPDGRRLASASEDHSVRVWDPISGHQLYLLKGDFWSVAFSHDSKRLATGLKSEPRKLVNDFLAGRAGGTKLRLVKERGGNEDSEAAVARGLNWLINHQQQDGSWRFNHATAPSCHDQCPDAGPQEEHDNAATGLALLALLGSGQTHQQGEYRTQIAAGLRFLAAQAISQSGDLQGTWASEKHRAMYAQGISTYALSEAYGMTGDATLKPSIDQVVRFIIQAQHNAGGWRYQPGEEGDLSVSGWQIMALESARHAKISVVKSTIDGYTQFLNSLEDGHPGEYKYRVKEPVIRPATTATGLLSRLWLRRDERKMDKDPKLEDGIDRLIKTRPLKDNLYFDYYASQLFLLDNHADWPGWNDEMRDFLVSTQRTDGHTAGSWDLLDVQGSKVGGRLYNTALALLILEVYYRFLPLNEATRQ